MHIYASNLFLYRPEITEDAVAIEIEDGRHPVIDALKAEQEQYVPNSTQLNVSMRMAVLVKQGTFPN